MIHFSLVAPEAGLVRPALEVAHLGLIEGAGHAVDDGVYVCGGKGAVSQLEVAIDVLLPEIFIGEEAVPPRVGEVVGTPGPGGGIIVPAVG